MTFPFDFLDAVFGGGTNSGSVQGSPTLDQGFAPVAGWMVSQAFAGAGPVGQYMGMLYGSPGSGIPRVQWGSGDAGRVDHGDYLDFTQDQIFNDAPDDGGSARPGYSGGPGPAAAATEPPPGEARTLERLDRGDGAPAAVSGPIEEVFVLGDRPDRQPSPHDWWPGMEAYLSSQRQNASPGGEIQLRVDPSPRIRSPRPRRPAARVASPVDPAQDVLTPPRPERDPVAGVPEADVPSLPSTGSASSRLAPWSWDASAPEQYLPWGAWDRPENLPAPRGELGRGDVGRLEAVPTVPVERSFWSRGGTGLAAGVMTGSLGVAAVMWWNPVGWAALGAALAIAGGVAATTASAVELSASYGGATTAEQDARMNRAVSASLVFSAPGGILGGVVGTAWADDPEEGFLSGGTVGGLIEGAASLPGVLRSLPGLWRAAMPWARSLALTPLWFLVAAGTGGARGSVRSLARVFAAQGRIAARVRQVEYLGTTPLLERDAAWARYQVFGTGTRRESVFRITYANGQQRIVLADRAQQSGRLIVEAKEGNLGQMFNATREAHIIGQARSYLDISTVTGGRVRYVVSTELGAARLSQRFGWEFPAETASGQLVVDWLPWPR